MTYLAASAARKWREEEGEEGDKAEEKVNVRVGLKTCREKRS
jgi:hypothetical protein